MLKGARCLGPKCALDRHRPPPGGQSRRRRRISDRGLQLREKQKGRYIYGMLERQFRKFFTEALRHPGITGDKLLELLERRLDNVIYRLGFASSRAQARQVVRHGHIALNGRKTDIPSCLVKPGDVIAWTHHGAKTKYYEAVVEAIPGVTVPGWLDLDKDKLVARVLTLPSPSDRETKFDEKAIVGYYSR